MRLLVTGGAGFIGSNFIRYWLERHPDDRITDLDLLTYAGDRRSLRDVDERHAGRHVLVQGDVSDAALVEQVVASDPPDAIVNFAAESHNSRAIDAAERFVRTNVVGTHTLLEVARRRRIARLHHISTCEVYGDLALDSRESFSETSPYRPRTPYNATKAAADHLVRAYFHTHGLPVTISNSANNYGPWQHPEKLISKFTTELLDGRPIPLYRHSENTREWLHVLDHCCAIEAILLRGRIGETYNVGTGEELSIEQVADALLAILGRPATLKHYVDDRPGHDRRYLLDSSKIRSELGWEPRIRSDEGLRSTVEWYQDHRWWWEGKRDAAAIDEFGWAARASGSGR